MIFCARRTHAVETSLCSRAISRRDRRRSVVGWPHDDRCDDGKWDIIALRVGFRASALGDSLQMPVCSLANHRRILADHAHAFLLPLGALRLFARAPLC